TLVGCDHEAVAGGVLEHRAPSIQIQDVPRRGFGRVDIQELCSPALVFGQRVEIQSESVAGGLVQKDRFSTGKQRRSFVDLVERIRTDDERSASGKAGRRAARV